jgi:tetratricopeptide (TPR) repeat protein
MLWPLFRRLALLAFLLLYLGALGKATLSSWLSRHGSLPAIQQALNWAPEDAALWSAYARGRSDVMSEATLSESIAAIERSLSLNPFDVFPWNELATAYGRRADQKQSEAALQASLTFIPHHPATAWRAANFLVQQGRSTEALPLLRRAAAYDPSLQLPVFDLAWKLLESPEAVMQAVVPDDLSSQIEYANFLVRDRKLLRESYPVWSSIRMRGGPDVVAFGKFYTEALAANNMGRTAGAVWRETQELIRKAAPASDENLVANGDFEDTLINAGLDWRIGPGSGFKIALDDFEAENGSRSLRIAFDGTANPEFSQVQQWVLVEPSTRYYLHASLKMENVTTDQGVYLHIAPQSVPESERWVRRTRNLVGSLPWTREQLEFETGPATTVVLLQLRREPSSKLNNLLQGRVWIDNVSVESIARR